MSQFALHPQLAADTTAIIEWPLCRVLLMEDANYPWLILVPARDGASELHDLTKADRALLIEEISRASEGLKGFTSADKINVAAFGNVVPQLHVHVIARSRKDPAWPGPVWGAATRLAYPASEREALVRGLKLAL